MLYRYSDCGAARFCGNGRDDACGFDFDSGTRDKEDVSGNDDNVLIHPFHFVGLENTGHSVAKIWNTWTEVPGAAA